MNGNGKGKLGLISIVVAGLILIGIVSFVIMKSNQTVKVWVPNKELSTGSIILEEDLKQISVPVNTPGDFINNKDMIQGYKLKNGVGAEQLFYANDFLSSWESYSDNEDIPDDYIITAIQAPDHRAVGGLIVAGDTIDVMGVSDSGKAVGFDQGDSAEVKGRDNIGTNVYYILSNVHVINTNSSLSEAQDNSMSDVVEDTGGDGSYYLVALSYDDAKKLRQAEGVLDLWLNISPKQNDDNPPLIAQMIGQSFSELHDAQIQVQDKDGNVLKIPENSEKAAKEKEAKEAEEKAAEEKAEKEAKEKEAKEKAEKEAKDKEKENKDKDKD